MSTHSREYTEHGRAPFQFKLLKSGINESKKINL